MRLVGTLHNEHDGRLFSTFLTSKGIQHELEIVSNHDWGSDAYGTQACRVWVIDEDQSVEAQQYLEEFMLNPHDPAFFPKVDAIISPKSKVIPMSEIKKSAAPGKPRPTEMGKITLYILSICILLFIFSMATRPPYKSEPINLPLVPLFTSPVNKALMYDYPAAYDYIDKAIELFGIEKVEDPATLPPEGKFLIAQYYKTPYWEGIYGPIVQHIRDKNAQWHLDAPLFEKIREGEVWRTITPVLLHHDLLHIFFNMIWLVILGSQMEKRLGGFRYILFILIAAIVSNTAQYLMSGPNFIGYSGVDCAMIVFIWARQRKAPWEGYQLQQSTLRFVALFIFSIAALQLVSFLLEISGNESFASGIANTAHISGGIIGYIMGKIPYFAWKQ